MVIKPSWPTAAVIVAFITAYVVLAALKVPREVLAPFAAIGTVVAGAMKALLAKQRPPPPSGPSVLEDDAALPRPVPTFRPPSRPANDSELLAMFDGPATWPPPPEAA